MTSKYFSQTDFDTTFHSVLRYADETYIAEEVGKSKSYISKMLNPNNPTVSVLFRAAAILAAWIARSPARGRLALRAFNTFVLRADVANQGTVSEELAAKLVRAEEELADIRKIVGELPEIRWTTKELVYQYRSAHAR